MRSRRAFSAGLPGVRTQRRTGAASCWSVASAVLVGVSCVPPGGEARCVGAADVGHATPDEPVADGTTAIRIESNEFLN